MTNTASVFLELANGTFTKTKVTKTKCNRSVLFKFLTHIATQHTFSARMRTKWAQITTSQQTNLEEDRIVVWQDFFHQLQAQSSSHLCHANKPVWLLGIQQLTEVLITAANTTITTVQCCQ